MKDINKRIQRQFTKWKKMFANHLFDRGLIPRTNKELLIKTQQTTKFKNSQRLEQLFPQKKMYKWPVMACKDAQYQ